MASGTVTRPASPAPPSTARGTPLVLVAGNPNAGKSTLFNALTGAHARVANYPGVTVSCTVAPMVVPGIGRVDLVDLPGTYSLSARSRDEQVAVDALLGRGTAPPDAAIVVADATALGRTLYLALEIIGTGVPVIVALSMMDEARSQGIEIDIDVLRRQLGAEVVPVVAPRRQGVDALARATMRVVTSEQAIEARASSLGLDLQRDVADLAATVGHEHPELSMAGRRAWAEWLLLSIDEGGAHDLEGVSEQTLAAVRGIRARAGADGRDLDHELIAGRYARVDAIVESAVRMRPPAGPTWTERIDSVLTHRIWGGVVFAIVMIALFQALFTWSEPAISFIETQIARVQDLVTSVMPAGPLRDLLADGVVAGVGNVVMFVPQIAMLFLFIGLMEDLGYLARVAFVIDRLMGRIGLHGKSFVPMLSGFSCAIPAVMATRTIENRTDRLLTMMVLPLMSCSARLPIYVLIIATVFSPSARVFGVISAGAVALFAMYALSVSAALGAAAVMRRTVFRGPRPTLVLELPPYRRPVTSVLLRNTWRQVRAFLVDAGTIILALTIVLWALLNYPRDPALTQQFAAERAHVEATVPAPQRAAALDDIDGRAHGAQLRNSVAGHIGHVLEPALEPLGFDWRIGVGVLGAFAAREVFVSTMGMVFDINNADEENQTLRGALREATWADGRPLMTPLTGVSLMVFFVLACQCMSTLAIVRRESGSWKWPALMFGYQTAFAYVASLVVYQGGRLLGWS